MDEGLTVPERVAAAIAEYQQAVAFAGVRWGAAPSLRGQA